MAGADIGNMNIRANQALEAGCDMLIVCNQTPALLLEVLDSVKYEQSPESAQRIEAFKQSMVRFSSKEFSITQSLSCTFLGGSTGAVIPPENPLNNTNSI